RPAHRDGRREDRGRHVLGAHGGPDAAGRAVRRRPRAPGPGSVGLPARGHQRLGRPRHRPGDRGCLMSGRPRTSTLVISGLFLAVLALYILVRPVPTPASAGTTQPGTTSSSTAPAATSTSPRPTESSRPSHTVSPSATP